MTDKEFRRLSKTELLEIIYELQRSEQRLKSENEALKTRLEDRRITIESSGSIAEAALRLNGVFEACEMAAEQYLNEMKARYDEKG